MCYSSDFRKCVLDYIRNGGSKAAASRRFGISRTSIYKCLTAEEPLLSEKSGPRGPRNLRYRSTTLIAARLKGRLTAPVLFAGSCDRIAFNTWLSEMLCPLLDDRHVVILDNATFHKGSETAALIRSCGASLLFLPPYSPELNPLEKDFANIKRIRQYNAEASIDEIINLFC